MHKFLKDIKNGEEFTDFYLMKNYLVQNKATGEEYFRVEISDKSMSCQGLSWEDPKRFDVGTECIGSIIKVKGTMQEYNGQPQVRIYNIRKAQESDKALFDMDSLVKSAPINIKDRQEDVFKLINTIEDQDYKKVCLHVFDKVRGKFASCPAGKTVHHAFLGGLIMHTSNMMYVACNISEIYSNIIDRSLLLAGTFLHDIAKIEEFDLSEANLVKDYSKEGQLLGHLYIGAANIREICEKLNIDKNKSLLLEHMILSHHGDGELGSPVQPKFAEAEALHLIDLMDSRLEIYAEEYEKIESGTFSPKNNWALGHRILKNK